MLQWSSGTSWNFNDRILILGQTIPLNGELIPDYSFLKLTFHDSVIFMSEQGCRCDCNGGFYEDASDGLYGGRRVKTGRA